MKPFLLTLTIIGLLIFEANCEGVTYYNPFSSWVTYETGKGHVDTGPWQCQHSVDMNDFYFWLHEWAWDKIKSR